MHEHNVDSVCFSVGGLSYAFNKLAAMGAENSTVPTANLRPWVDRVVEKSHQLNKEQAIKMINLAITWKDAKMFSTVMKSPSCVLGVLNMDTLSTAWRAFSFEAVKLRSKFSLILSTFFDIRNVVLKSYWPDRCNSPLR
jgi:hypothetical protein